MDLGYQRNRCPLVLSVEGRWPECRTTGPSWNCSQISHLIFWSDGSHTGLPANGKLPGWSLRRLRSYSAAVLPDPSWVNWCNCYGYAWHYLALIRIFNLTLRPVEVSGVMKDFLMCSEEIWTDPRRGDCCNTYHQPLNICLIRISTLRLSW